ncbi:MAG: hypothetical protein LBM38_00950 [Clostridiales bacterium]|jgi:flagellar basal body-associated protein FliL|nr:hypothetical protein [Clostridiales bacterium]
MSKKNLMITILTVAIIAILGALGYYIYLKNSTIKPMAEEQAKQVKAEQQKQVVAKVVGDSRLIKINSEVMFNFFLKKDIELTAFDNKKLSTLIKENYDQDISKYYGKYITVRTADTVLRTTTDPNEPGNLTYVFVFAEEELVYSTTIPDSSGSAEFNNLIQVCVQLEKEYGIPSPTPSPTPTPTPEEEQNTEAPIEEVPVEEVPAQ